MPILPTFKHHAIQKNLGDGIHFKSETTIHPKYTTYIDYMVQAKKLKKKIKNVEKFKIKNSFNKFSAYNKC